MFRIFAFWCRPCSEILSSSQLIRKDDKAYQSHNDRLRNILGNAVDFSEASISMRAFPMMSGNLIGPRTRFLDDWRPALHVGAHEGRKIGRAHRRGSRTLALELRAHSWILERRDNGGI